MKSFKMYVAAGVFALTLISCDVRTGTYGSSNRSVRAGKSIPPGQAKKIYGTKSARPFAPGQNK